MTGTAVVPALATVLKQTWGLNNTEAGWILGTYWVGYVIAVPVLSGLTDRVAPRIVYGVSLAIGVFGCLGFAYFAQGLWTAILFHTLMGVGLAGTYMPGLKILSDRLIGTTQSRGTAFYVDLWHWSFAVILRFGSGRSRLRVANRFYDRCLRAGYIFVVGYSVYRPGRSEKLSSAGHPFIGFSARLPVPPGDGVCLGVFGA